LPAKGTDTMARVLIVDDDKGFRSILSEYLGSQGYECSLAANAEQAKERLCEHHYDMVLSDLHMPGASGLDLLRYVSSSHPLTRFILMTGACDRRIRTECLIMGACECLDKPFRLAELHESMTRALESKVHLFPTAIAGCTSAHAI